MYQDDTNGREWKSKDSMTPLCFLIASGSAVFFGFCGWQLAQLIEYFAPDGATDDLDIYLLFGFFHFMFPLVLGAFGLSFGCLVASRVLPAEQVDASPDQDDSSPI